MLCILYKERAHKGEAQHGDRQVVMSSVCSVVASERSFWAARPQHASEINGVGQSSGTKPHGQPLPGDVAMGLILGVGEESWVHSTQCHHVPLVTNSVTDGARCL